ncbi:MAG: hypothetical protein J1D88_02040 [Treponema sp.]|nr:hypothetical protein [Treponema sp.]
MDMSAKLIFAGIAFLVMAGVFCGIAFFLRLPQQVQKAPICKQSGSIFFLIGSLTGVVGLLALLFRNEATKTVAQICALVYLLLLTMLLVVFIMITKDSQSK